MGAITRAFANNILTGGKFDATDMTGTLPAATIGNPSMTNITDIPALTAVSTVTSDPPSPDAGQMWYNSSQNMLKAYVLGPGSWASGGNMPLARDSHAGFGIQTAAGVVGGRTTPGPSPALTTSVNTFVEYDGSSWTEKANINQQRWLGEASGVVTSAILYSGAHPASNNWIANAETWDGSSWTETADVNTARRSLGGAGITSTSALAFGGRTSSSSGLANTESWNGSSWTEVNDLNTARAYNTGSGLVSSAIYAGGNSGNSVNNAETWDGTSWTEVAEINTSRHGLSSSGGALAALIFSGRTSPPGTNRTNTEAWDGSAWTEVADVATARYDSNAGGSQGSSNTAIMTGGYGTAYSNGAEEWTQANISKRLGAS